MTLFSKSLIVILISTLALVKQASAQLEGGIKIGASTIEYVNSSFGDLILGEEGFEEYKVSVDDINFGYHLGLYGRLLVWKVFLQPEVTINSQSINYRVEDFQDPGNFQILREQYTTLDIPVLLGLKMKWFNIQGGVAGQLPLLSVSELKNIEGYTLSSESLTYAYLGGVGFDIWNFRLDFRFELSTTFFGDHITYKGNKYQFDDKSNRLIAGLAYKF